MRHTTTAAATIAALLLATLTACSSGSDDPTAAADIPTYKITSQDASGNKRDITIEVDHTTDLRAIFDDATGKLNEEAGYYVMINCSTGGTKSADNRLANGQHAIGRMGTATTGLKDGESEFAALEGRKCPVDPADQAKQDAAREKAREAAGLPPSPAPQPRKAFIDGLNAIDSDIVHGKDDKAISRGINQCSSIKSSPDDQAKLIDLTNQRFTSPNHPEGHGLAKAEQILDLVHKHICPTF